MYCGARILWIPGPGGRPIPIEAKFTPYRRTKGEGPNLLYTSEGGKIACEVLPEERDREANGFAHMYHFCTKKPVRKLKRPLTRREQYKALGE